MEKINSEDIYALIDSGEYETAKEILSTNLEQNPKDIECQKMMALCEVNLENYDNARKILEDVVKYSQDDAMSWYYLGCCYDALNKFHEAKHAYSTVIELRPEYIDVYKSFAIAYIKNQEADKAIELIDKAIKISEEEDYSLYYIGGTACMAAQKFEDSIKYIKKALELNPDNIQLYNNLGTAYLTTGKTEEALETYKKTAEIDPKDSLAYFNIGSILQIQDKHEQACEYFAKANELEPEDQNYITAWAVSEVKAGRLKEAIEHYKYLAACYPQKINYRINLASCYEAIGEYDIAIALLKQLVLISPKSAPLMKKLATAYMKTGQYANAKEIYEKIIKQGSTSYETHYELALLCVKTDNIDRAEQILKKVCKLQPDFAPAHKDLGVIYLNKRLFDYAKDEFEQAYKYDSENYSIVIEYANFLHATSNFEKADEMYQKALEIEPQNPNALAFSALNKTHLKQIDQALEQIKSALEKSHESAFLFFIAGRIYFLAEDYDCAKTYLVKSYELEKTHEVQNLLGLCYFELGNYNQAQTIFKNLLEKAPLNINLLLSIAKCHIKMEQKDEALEYLNKITEIFPECEEAQELIREIS